MRILIALLVIAPAATLAAQTEAVATPKMVVSPSNPDGGALVRVTVEGLSSNDGDVAHLSGRMAGEPLHFTLGEDGAAHAIGAIPTDVTDSLVARAEVEYASGRTDSLRATIVFPPEPPTKKAARSAGASRLRVDQRFSRTDARTEARIARENERAREVGRRAHETPRLWTSPFARPRASRITSKFGSGRVFNGRVTSRHGGVDFAGKRGAPVYAANRGVVALVDTFFLAGSVVYVDHGEGVVTGYFHLSRIDVAVGDTVQRGGRIGLVGASGRVTGPHLHWSARYGALSVNPLDLITVTTRKRSAPNARTPRAP